jgi:hypothetical protein
MSKHLISLETALQNIRPGDMVTIPSGMGGIFTTRFERYGTDGTAEVRIEHAGTDWDGARRTVSRDEIGFPILSSDLASGKQIRAVRDEHKRQHLVTQSQNSFTALISLPEQCQYRDHDRMLSGMAKTVNALEYYRGAEKFIRKRMPDADATELSALIQQVSAGEYVAPLMLEDAAANAGLRLDLSDWCDVEMVAPIRQCGASHLKDVAALVHAMNAQGIAVGADFNPMELRDIPIGAEGWISSAVDVAKTYLDTINMDASIEVRTTEEARAALVTAGLLVMTVEPDRWHCEIMRPFSKANEAWLQEARSRFEQVEHIDPFDLDVPASGASAQPNL